MSATGVSKAAPDIGFLFLGGMHQALHIAPVATALARRDGVAVTAYVPPADAAALLAMLRRLDGDAAPRIAVVPMRPRGIGRWLGGKVGALVGWRTRLLRHDALVAAERTSTLLKRWPGRRPFLLHIPHGAGDRARTFDPRIRFFDHQLVNGRMLRERTLAQGLATPDTCEIVGSVKLSALARLNGPAPRLFGDGRPVVLYNPHFDVTLSSWPLAEGLVEAIAADGRFNLVVAPHARLGAKLDADRPEWLARAEARGVLVDLRSERLGDMTYTRAADIYLGDVSSQVYEFLSQPRPTVFVDAHGASWRGNPDYTMWTTGEVAGDVPGTLAALGRARDRHAEFAAHQAALVADVLGAVDPGVPDRAADAIIAALPPRRR